jgi:hypothetical protein
MNCNFKVYKKIVLKIWQILMNAKWIVILNFIKVDFEKLSIFNKWFYFKVYEKSISKNYQISKSPKLVIILQQ